MSSEVRLAWRGGRLALEFPLLAEDQRAALVHDREVALTAGAGAGKTFTLAARYVSLLAELAAVQEDPHPRQVLVLTFTEKATQEMKSRCYRMLLAVVDALRDGAEALLAAGMPRAELAAQRLRWQRLLDGFDAAAIHTFHGYCARVVAEFPAETGIAPGNAVSEAGDANLAASQAAEEALDEALGRPAGEADPSIDDLLDVFGGRGTLAGAIETLVERRLELGGAIARAIDAPGGDGPVLDASPISPSEVERFVTTELEPFVDTVLRILEDVSSDVVSKLQAWQSAERPADAFGWFDRYRGGLGVLCVSGRARSLKDRTVMGLKGDFRGDYARAKAALVALQPVADGWNGRIGDLELLPSRADVAMNERLRSLARLGSAAIERHRLRALQAATIDFSEMILATRRALAEHPGVVSDLRERHRYLMVDECQDTDAAQWDVLRRLARADPEVPEDRLFLVGDPKQSIYGFRGGDVAVFNRAVAASPARLALRGNYRSLHALVHFANSFFDRALGAPAAGRPDYEASYEAITPARQPRPGAPPLPAGSVTLVRRPEGSTGKAADLADAEARWIAEHIETTGLGWVAEEPRSSPRIAILLRSRTHLRAFLDALRLRGIEHVVVGGSGFWGRPEVVDLGNVLLALARRDAVATVGALRSPLVGLDDPTLTELAAEGALATFGDAPLGDRWSAPVQEACARWQRWRELKEHASPAELVAAIRQDAGHAYSCAFDAPGGEAERNVARLFDKADAWAASGKSLDALAAVLRGSLEEEPREAPAVMPVSTAAVAVLTVHAAKGLEWPLVYLPQLGAYTGRAEQPALLHGRDGNDWSLACRVLDPGSACRRTTRPPAYHRLQRRILARDDAESRRLLYVACTRAKDHLVLVGAGAADAEGAEKDASRLVAGWATSLTEEPEWLHRAELGTGDLAEPEAPAPVELEAPTAADARRIAAIADEGVLQISASSLDLLRTDPARWHERVVLGVPEMHAREPELRRDLAAARGTTIHALLEDGAIADDEAARARWCATARGAGIPEPEVAAAWPNLAAQLAVLRGSTDLAAILDAPGHAEVGFRLRRGRVVVAGRIDRLCRDPADGAWMVVDYKSEDPGHDPGAAAQRHRHQLLAYSVAASEVLVAERLGSVARAAVLFTRTGRLERLPAWCPGELAEFEAWLAAAV